MEYYNLDAVISVGYRVNSKRGIQFRIWANKILKDFLIKGYAINEQSLKEQTEKPHLFKANHKAFRQCIKEHQVDMR